MAENPTPSEPATLTERLVAEGLIGLAPAARLFGAGRKGRGKHPSTLTRYISVGVPLPDGNVVKLEAIRVGSALMTSQAAVLRFIVAQQTSDTEQPQSTLAIRRNEQLAASAELDGILKFNRGKRATA